MKMIEIERRFKKTFVSFHIQHNYKGEFDKELRAQLPEGTAVMRRKDDIDTGCTVFLLYNPTFDELANNELVPTLKGFVMPDVIPSSLVDGSPIIGPGVVQ